MTTTEHTQRWLDTAAHDWETVEALQVAHPRTTLVFAHWTLEKLSKALWIRERSGAIPPASDDVAELLAATSFMLTPAQTLFVEHLKAFHDDIVETDLARPTPQLAAGETYYTLLAQADTLRQQLLEVFLKERV